MLVALGFPSVGSAQDAPDPWVQLAVVEVEPSRVDEFVAVQRDMAEKAKKSKTPWRTVSRTAVFGDTYRFLIASPSPDLASLAGGSDDLEWRALVNRAERCITSRHGYAVRVMYEASNMLPEGEEPEYMVVNMATVAPGREQDYMDVMNADFLPHFKEAGVHHATGSLALGGEGGFIHVFYLDEFADLDQGSPAMRAMSAEGAMAATAKLAGIVIRNEVWVARVVPEASYSALPEETESGTR